MTLFWRSLLDTFVLLSLLSLGAVPGAESAGPKSTSFDLRKYSVSDEILITPKTHPNLFSFTGRWTRRWDTFTAAPWAGPYVTMLVFGTSATLKLKPERKGRQSIEFWVSVDGGPDQRYLLPEMDTLLDKFSEVYVPITFPDDIWRNESDKRLLLPHSVRITSSPKSPLAFEGVDIANTVIRQGTGWIDHQDEVGMVEFIGGQPERMEDLVRSEYWAVPDSLGIRHSHIDIPGACLADNTSESALGMHEQYFLSHPLNKSVIVPTDDDLVKWNFFSIQTWFSRRPDTLVLDFGKNDAKRGVEPDVFGSALSTFLDDLRVRARLESKILVMLPPHKDAPYYDETLAAVESRHDPLILAVELPRAPSYRQALARLLCEHVPHTRMDVCYGVSREAMHSELWGRKWEAAIVLVALWALYLSSEMLRSSLLVLTGRKHTPTTPRKGMSEAGWD